MIRPLDLAYYAGFSLLLLALTVPAATAEELTRELPAEVLQHDVAGALPYDDERQVGHLETKGGFLGYSFIGADGYGGRAHPYGFLRSSESGGLFYKNLQKDSNLDLEGSFLNENDYHGDLILDYRGDYRLHLRVESLFHNLTRELLFSPDFTSFRADPPFGTALYSAVQAPPADYGVAVSQELADFRYRLHNFPLHVNLGYWRLVREGARQLRFADAAFEGDSNKIFAVSRAVNQQTQEGRLSLDAHLGYVDVIYNFRVRYFEDRLATPTATYLSRNDMNGNPVLLPGLQQHNEEPHSRFISHTVKLHSSLAGGMFGGGSYSIVERVNHSRLTDTRGAKHLKATQQNVAGDLAYTPFKELTMALKYRRQELDHDQRGVLTNLNYVVQVQPVKPSIDSSKDVITGTATYRPGFGVSLTGEYRGEYLKRSQVSPLPTPTTWGLPEHTKTQTGSLALLYRPVKGVRTSAKYSYTTTDHPSYGSSFEQRHHGEFLATYTNSNRWGATGNVIVKREWNDKVEHFLVNFPFTDPVTYSIAGPLSRERRTQNANFSVWGAPLSRLTLSANYAFLNNKIKQDVLFTGVVDGSQAASEFLSRSHIYGINAGYAPSEKLDLSLALQQIRSRAAFEPEAKSFTVIPGSTFGITEISEQETVINMVSTRGEYHFTPQLSTSLEYTLREYDEGNTANAAYNGTVHVVAAYLTTKW